LLVYILKKDKKNYSKILIFFFITLCCVFFSKSENFLKHYSKAENKRQDITHFLSSLNKIENLSKKYPNNEIVLISNYVWEYELVSSLFKFMSHRNINNKIFLKVNISENDLNNRTEKMLFKRLIEVSYQAEGINSWANSPELEWGYEDLNTFSGSTNCIEVEIYRIFATWIVEKNSEKLCDKSAH